MSTSKKLPASWAKSRIGDLVEDRIEQGLPEDKREFTYIDISAVDNRRKEIIEPRVLPATSAPSRARQQVKRDDVLVSTIRPNLNAVALVPPQLDGAIASTGFAILRPVLLEPRWLFYVVQTEDFVFEMSALVKGSLYPAIRPRNVHDYVMPVPPLAEQKRITAKLGRLLKRTRKVHESLEALPELIQQYRAAMLEAACTGRLVPTEAELAHKERRDFEPASVLLERILVERRTKWEAAQLAKMRAVGTEPKDDKWKKSYNEPAPAGGIDQETLPKGWSMTRLEHVSWSAGYGTSVKCSYEANGPAVLRIPNVKNGQIVLGDLKFAESAKTVSSETPLEPADFIIIRTNGSRDLVGTGALVDKEFEKPHYFASYLIRYRLVSESFYPAWLKVIWAAPGIRERIFAMAASTTGQYNISLGNLNDLEIPLPPLAEQHRLVAEVKHRLAALARVEVQIKAALEQTRQLHVSFFHRSMAGNLVLQSGKDKPASYLLAAIKKLKKWRIKSQRRVKYSGPPPDSVSRDLEKTTVSFIAMKKKKEMHATIYAIDFRSLLHELARAKQYAAGLRGGEADISTRSTVSAKDLWKASGLTIDEFYAVLKQEMGKTVREVGPDRLLEAIE